MASLYERKTRRKRNTPKELNARDGKAKVKKTK
jgi:hypothetical protein